MVTTGASMVATGASVVALLLLQAASNAIRSDIDWRDMAELVTFLPRISETENGNAPEPAR